MAGHGEHVCWPDDAWLLPALHGVQVAAPPEVDTEPGGHAKHDDDELPPGVLLWLPAVHAVHADA